ncbi:hypothetical protein ABH892_000560 [Paenibacillus sp. RC254]
MPEINGLIGDEWPEKQAEVRSVHFLMYADACYMLFLAVKVEGLKSLYLYAHK